MPNYTENLNLFKYDVEKDRKSTFNVGLFLNDNFDKIDEFSKNIDEQKQDVSTAVKHTENISVGGVSEPIYVDAYGNAKSTNLSIANERFDGQWVSKQMTLSTATAVGTYEIDLSDYLPNDNYNYEVLCSGRIVNSFNTGTSGDAYSYVYIYSDIFSNSNNIWLCSSSHSCTSTGHAIIPVSKKLIIERTGATDNGATFYACGYRRIGLNN